MPQDTFNYGFKKYSTIIDGPEMFDNYVDDTSNNFEIIDTELNRVEGLTSVIDVLPDIATRDAIVSPPTGLQVHVIDASEDDDVYSSWAQYIYTGAVWVKTNEDDINTSFGTFYQKETDPHEMITVGTNTFTNNKVGLILTQSTVQGGVSLNEVEGRIEHSGRDTNYLFNATATIRDPSTPNMIIYFILVKNGTIFIEPSMSYGRLEASGSAMSLDAASNVFMSDGDYIEVFCKTNKLDGEFWVDSMQLQIVQVPQ